jgi:hypothetical protein
MKAVLAISGALGGAAMLILTDLLLAANAGGGSLADDFREFLRWSGTGSFALGVLLGHWFHPGSYETGLLGSPASIIVLIATWAVLSGLLAALFYAAAIAVPPLIPLLAGMLAGAILWPV